MYFIAHRGKVSKEDTPNSKFSLLKALSLPYVSGIECDVRLTKDHKVVVIHDPIIDFVSNGSGIVKYMTFEELKKFEFGDIHHKETILSLEELLACIHTEKLILIELKGEEKDKRLVEEVYKVIQKYQHLDIIIISFWYSLLQQMRKIDKKVKIGLLIGYFLNQKHIYNHFDYNLFEYSYLEQIDMNKKLMFFTINQKKQVEEIRKKREDVFVITDRSSYLSRFD